MYVCVHPTEINQSSFSQNLWGLVRIRMDHIIHSTPGSSREPFGFAFCKTKRVFHLREYQNEWMRICLHAYMIMTCHMIYLYDVICVPTGTHTWQMRTHGSDNHSDAKQIHILKRNGKSKGSEDETIHPKGSFIVETWHGHGIAWPWPETQLGLVPGWMHLLKTTSLPTVHFTIFV